MSNDHRSLRSGALLIGALFLLGRPAWAYIDPGTGSYLFQLLVGGVLGAAFLARVYWNKLKRLFGRGVPADEDEEEE